MTEKTPPRRGRRQLFSITQIAEVALSIADREGIDAVTMQRVASELGTAPMTLYGYVASKDELLDAVLDFAVADAGRTPATSDRADWRAELRNLVRYGYRNLNRHPAIVEIRLRRPILRPEALRFGERAMRILLGAGMPPDEAAAAFRTIYTYLFGFAAVSPQRQEKQNRKAAAAAIADLDPERYPALREHRTVFSQAMSGRAAFDNGLEILLDGIADRLNGPSR